MFWGAQCVLSLAQYWHIVPLFGHSLMLLVQAASFPLLLKQSDQKSKSSFKKVQSNIKSKLETLFGWSRSMIHERSKSGWFWVVSTGRATESRIYGSLTKKIVVEMLQIYKLLLRWHRKDLSIGQWRGTNIVFSSSVLWRVLQKKMFQRKWHWLTEEGRKRGARGGQPSEPLRTSKPLKC